MRLKIVVEINEDWRMAYPGRFPAAVPYIIEEALEKKGLGDAGRVLSCQIVEKDTTP